MLVMIFLVGILCGLLAGAVACVRYVRQEMAASIGPKLRLIELHLEVLESEVGLVLTGQLRSGEVTATRPAAELSRPVARLPHAGASTAHPVP
jgi:hypothetical protein